MIRKLPIFIITLLLIFIPTIVIASDLNEIQLFFIPEQGFVRVNTKILLESDTTYLDFELFPGAQITAISAANYKDHTFYRSNSNTKVEIAFESENNSQILQLSYEGFLVNYDSKLNHSLDEELLWFPKLGQGIHPYQLTVMLPTNFIPYFNGDLKELYQSTFSSFTWKSSSDSYPVIYFTDPATTAQQKLTHEIEIEFEIETEVEVGSEFDFKPEPPLAEPELISDEDIIKSQMQSLTEAITNQDQQSILGFIDPQMHNVQGFLNILGGWSLSFGTQTFSINELKIDNSLAKVTGVINDSQNNEYCFISTWQKKESLWLLTAFKMIPDTYSFFDPESDPRLTNWIEDLQQAIITQDLPWLDYHLTMPFDEKLPLIEFFLDITAETIWETIVISELDNRIIALIYDPHTTTKLKLEFYLSPTELQRVFKVNISMIM